MPTVALDGTRFYYEERGKGEPLLLIHGTGGSSATMASLAQQLSSSYRVISYDRRGFSKTAVPPADKKEYVRRHADDASALLHALGAPRARVFGWSMGGVVALALALHHPADVSRLVLYEAPLHARKHLGLRMARKLGGALGLAKVGMHKRAAARFFRFALERTDGKNAFDELEASLRAEALANARAVLAELRGGTGEELSAGELARLCCPIDLVAGGRSAAFLQEAVQRCAKLFPAARVVRVPDGDHVMNLRQPAVLARAIEDLLAPSRPHAET